MIDVLSNYEISETGCFLWLGGTHKKKGYGYFYSPKTQKTFTVHRLVYEMTVKKIDKGKELDHLCRTTSCINPDHLEEVTTRENVLRGIGPTAMNARKTHCKRGHPLAGENLRMKADGSGRECIACQNMHNRKHWLARKQREGA